MSHPTAAIAFGITVLASTQAFAAGDDRASTDRLPAHTVVTSAEPTGRHAVPGGRVTVSPTGIPSGEPDARISVTLTLSRRARGESFGVRLPPRWTSVEGPRHLPRVRVNAARRPVEARGRARIVELGRFRRGSRLTLEIRRLDPPAGRYSLDLLWGTSPAAVSVVRHAPVVVHGRTLLPAANAVIREPRALRVDGRAIERYAFASDPSAAADPFGNLWYSFLVLNLDPDGNALGNNRIVVNRLPPDARFRPVNTGLPRRPASALQDKNMIAVDGATGSPHRGRIYVVWSEGAFSGQSIVISYCDTIVSGAADPARCDEPTNWTAPAQVTDRAGSHIAADVAPAPNGDVYVVWWNYSAANRIEGDRCAAASNCALSPSWGTDQAIDDLDGAGGPIPFFCPIVAAPAGRISPVPTVAVGTVGANAGRVYVTNADIRPSPGTTKCSEPAGQASDRPWDVFVSSRLDALPQPGTQVSLTGDLQGDNFLPWMDADDVTGGVHVAFYTTSPDSSRHTSSYSMRAVNPGTGSPTGQIVTLASKPSNFSGSFTRNEFDYGDYQGIEAAGGYLFPAWTDGRRPAFPCCEVMLRRVLPDSTLLGEQNLTSSFPEGRLEGAEISVAATPSGATARVLVGANDSGAGGGMLAFVSENGGASFTRMAVPTDTAVPPQAPAPAPPLAPSGSPSGSPSAGADRRPPRLRLTIPKRQRLLRNRVLLARVSCDEACSVSASGTVTVRRSRRAPLGRVERTLAAGIPKTLKLRLRAAGLSRVRRGLHLGRRVTASVRVTASDSAGNSVSRSRSIRVRK